MRPIIFLHGGPGFQDYLKPYFTNISDKFNSIFFDQLQGKDIKMADLLKQLDDFVSNCETSPIILGHSWGGVLATEYAKTNQSKIHALVLMSTGLNSKQWTLYNNELEAKGMSDITREELFFTKSELACGKKMFEMDCWGGFSEETFDSIFEDYLTDYDLLQDLKNINIPILNVFGENDLRFSKAVTTSFKGYNSKILDLEIKDSGHFPFLLEDNKRIIINELEKFL